MTTIQFTRDFQGWATGNQFYVTGQVADLPDPLAKMCVEEEAAVYVPVDPPAAELPAKKLGRPKKVK